MKKANGAGGYFNLNSIKEILSDENMVSVTAECFAALSDSARVKIFMLLCHTKLCVADIADFMEMTAPGVSHHLKILKETDLIESYRDGKEVFYAASHSQISRTMHGIIEKLMKINCPDFESKHEKINASAQFRSDQIKIIRQVHDFLCENISRRFTIEDLSKKFGMNTTTLKTVFKDVYGTSLAFHIKEHRMKKAAELLAKTELSVSEIASAVGYESQGKFSATFKEFYKMIPTEYREPLQKH
ncbi:metalloregulator ArsR/SmtB family transcription factor [Treponema sp.]|uniref:metalloregulator ArsR/SmtB family transcription factor n=1 Tax=Treponema sp. TaxID=166 RepID=UPI003F126F9D